MREQIQELLASPQAVQVQTFLIGLIDTIQNSPLLIVLLGLLAGLILGAGLTALVSGRKRRTLAAHWQTELTESSTSYQNEITELKTTRDSLRHQIETLNHKSQGLNKTLEQDRAELLKQRARLKSLELIVEEKDQKIQKTIDEAAQRIAQHRARHKTLNAVLDRRTTELEQLKSAAAQPQPRLPISETLLDSIKQRDQGHADEVAKRVNQLDQQRQALLDERDALAEREQHYAEQLTAGDDTRAYLDETLILAADKTLALNITDESVDSTQVDSRSALTDVETEGTDGTEVTDDTSRTSRLWHRVKTTVSRRADKVRSDKTEA